MEEQDRSGCVVAVVVVGVVVAVLAVVGCGAALLLGVRSEPMVTVGPGPGGAGAPHVERSRTEDEGAAQGDHLSETESDGTTPTGAPDSPDSPGDPER